VRIADLIATLPVLMQRSIYAPSATIALQPGSPRGAELLNRMLFLAAMATNAAACCSASTSATGWSGLYVN
jgi:hypothetical protein